MYRMLLFLLLRFGRRLCPEDTFLNNTDTFFD